jgi:hypothetical protein
MSERLTYRLIGVRRDGTHIDLDRRLTFERALQVRSVLIGAGGFSHVLILSWDSRVSSD